MNVMRIPLRAIAALLLSVGAAPAQGPDPLGAPDSLYFGAVTGVPGHRVIVPLVVANDAPCASMTIPVAYPASGLTADSVTFTGGRAANFALLSGTIHAASGRIVIGAVDLNNTPMAAGRGAVAWLHFTIAGTIAPGEILVVDTGYYSDPAKLLFLAHAGDSMVSYLPVVVAGVVTTKAPNRPPTFLPVVSPTVREGDVVAFSIFAADPDGTPLTLAMVDGPAGAIFSDRGAGHGDFQWRAPFTGPYSASFAPIGLRLSADDGEDATVLELALGIVNVNRSPVLTVPDTVAVTAYDSLNWSVRAIDPDLEPVKLAFDGLPSPAQVSAGDPPCVQWRPVQADTGSYHITVRATDLSGGLATASTVLRVSPTSRVEFALDSVSGYSDQDVVLQVHMKNLETLSGFELLFNLDPTAVTIPSINRNGTRTENWEMFAVETSILDHPGDVHIVARADINDGTSTPLLSPGEGPIVNIRLHLSANESFAGLGFPVRFVFRTPTANTAIDAAATIILQNEIAYTHGRVDILEYKNKLPGDINLNGLAFEVGDVVYFANFFSNPSLYPLSYEQRANSDVNGDGTPATIADLVYMINVITGGGLSRRASWGLARAEWWIDPSGQLEVTGGPYAGAYIEIGPHGGAGPFAGPALEGMTVGQGSAGGVSRLVAYSLDGAAIDPSRGALLSGLAAGQTVKLELSDPLGFPVVVAPRATLPREATLLGNYPNPFNPSTAIRFSLAVSSEVEIDIINILGRRVQTLAGSFTPGEHELIWHGDEADGSTAGSGVYFYRFRAGSAETVGRMLLLK
jgi:hypothetical protein